MRLNSTLPSVGLPGRVSEAVPLTSENWKASRASLAATPGNGPGVSKLISPPRSPRGASPTHGGAQTPPMPAAWLGRPADVCFFWSSPKLIAIS
eukprot:g27991.t1